MDTTPVIFSFVAGFFLLAFVTMTSFIKVSVVLMIVRQSLGLQQVPSNIIVMTLAVALSLYSAFPAIEISASNLAALPPDAFTPANIQTIWGLGIQPFQEFMQQQTSPEHLLFFVDFAEDTWTGNQTAPTRDNIAVLIPAFMISQLTTAFEIGFLLYLPFMAIDLALTGILMALGMQMVQPNIIAVPFKLLVFVSVDGWSMLAQGLVMTNVN